MRATALLMTIAMLTAMVIWIKILDNLYAAYGIMLACGTAGFAMARNKRYPG